MNAIAWTATQIERIGTPVVLPKPQKPPKPPSNHYLLTAGTYHDFLYGAMQDRHGWRPTVNEICRDFGWSRHRTWGALRKLMAHGLVESSKPGPSRGAQHVETLFWLSDGI